MADYGKQKSAKPRRNSPSHSEHNAPGGPDNPFGARPDKAALLERMREAAKRAQGGPGSEVPEGEPVVRSEGEA